MNKRLITKRQEEALKLVHHDFIGLSQTEAAKRMNISQAAVSNLLAKVKEILPDYFPILTKLETQIYHYYMVEGWGVDEIAEYTESSPDTIYKTLQRAKAKGMFFTETKKKMLSYNSEMDDNQIKQKF